MNGVVMYAAGYHENLEKVKPGALPIPAIRNRLEKRENLCDIAKHFRLLTDPAEEAHLREHWYNENGNGYWPQHDVEAIVRQSYLELLDLYEAQPRPIRTVWVAGCGTFAITLDVSPQQITRTVMTPPVSSGAEALAANSVVVQETDGQITVTKEKPLKF